MDQQYLERLHRCSGFAWDQGNRDKNRIKHNVYPVECEEVFFNQPLIIGDDPRHSLTEQRFYALGKTDAQRLLFIVFTIRNNLIRVISARDMSRRERDIYHAQENHPPVPE